MKVLLVEDDPVVAELIVRRLQHLGCEVLVATDGTEAERLACEEIPGLILVDLGLEAGPRSGVRLLHALAVHPVTADIPRYIHSSYMVSEQDMPITRSMADGVIMKPASLAALGALVAPWRPLGA